MNAPTVAGSRGYAARPAHAVLHRDVHGPGALVPLDAALVVMELATERGHRAGGDRDRGGARARGGAGARSTRRRLRTRCSRSSRSRWRRAHALDVWVIWTPLYGVDVVVRAAAAVAAVAAAIVASPDAAAPRLTMAIAEYGRLDGLGLADLVRRREVTPAELLEEAIARAERVNPRVNAIVTPLYEQARRDAARPAAVRRARFAACRCCSRIWTRRSRAFR